MATKKRLGHKSKVTFAGVLTVGLKGFTAPEKSREKVEVGCLGETQVEYLDSEPVDLGEFKMTVFHEPGEALSNEIIDTKFHELDSDDRVVPVVIEWPGGVTDTFSVRILKLSPAETTSKTAIERTIEGVLVTPIVRAPAA